MGYPGDMPMPTWFPPIPGVNELNLGDAWRAVWVETTELPKEAPVIYAYAALICDDKGYVTRAAGAEKWGVVEGAVGPAETIAGWLKRATAEQTGAMGGKGHLLGYYACRATSHNPDFPVGTSTARPVYLYVATRMKDLGRDAGYERRRLPLNEFAGILRSRYPELHQSMPYALDRYFLEKAAGAV